MFAVAALVALGACKKNEETPPGGNVLDTLESTTIDGASFNGETLKGKPSIVMFVSPTCPHCVKELPIADKVARDKNANVVAVFIVGKAENAKGVIEHTKFSGDVLIDDGSLKKRYGVRAVPYTLVLGADGMAKSAFRGAQEGTTLRDALDDVR